MHNTVFTSPFIVTMQSLFFPVLLSFLFLSGPSVAARQAELHLARQAASPQSEIPQACNSTRYPALCEAYLLRSGHLPPNPTALQIIQAAVSISSENLNTAQTMVKNILDTSAGNQNRTTASRNCLDVLHNSDYRIQSTLKALPLGKMKDVRAWMSGALVFQYDCWSALKYANDTPAVNSTMSFLNNSLLVMTSSGLSMMASYDLYGNDTSTWKVPRTERDGFWEASGGGGGPSSLDFKGGVPKNLKPNAKVCKGGKGCYKTVQDAVNDAPSNGNGKFVIQIDEGVYAETVRVPLEKKNVVFLGAGMGKTVITGSLSVSMIGISTFNSATVGVEGDGFMATGVTFQNTAGSEGHQAVAYRSSSDLSILENCEFLGNQDTLYAHSLRQFYKSCRIVGNVDFIFGFSASVFHDCAILVCPRTDNPDKGENNAITAHGRTDPAQTTGLVFKNCTVEGTKDYTAIYDKNPKPHKDYLGRPWKEYSRTVFLECEFGNLIQPQGWMPWNGDFGLSTLYFGEYNNRGKGADSSSRVKWSSKVPAEHIGSYSVKNFIQGNEWIPSSS